MAFNKKITFEGSYVSIFLLIKDSYVSFNVQQVGNGARLFLKEKIAKGEFFYFFWYTNEKFY